MTDVPLLVDASVLLPYLRGNADGRRIETHFKLSERGENVYLSVVTVAEILAIARYNHWGDARLQQLYRLLENVYIIDTLDTEIVLAYTEFYVEAMSHGKGIGQNDLWLAATAKVYGLTILTADTDFRWIPAPMLKVLFFQPGEGANSDDDQTKTPK